MERYIITAQEVRQMASEYNTIVNEDSRKRIKDLMYHIRNAAFYGKTRYLVHCTILLPEDDKILTEAGYKVKRGKTVVSISWK